MSYEIYPTSEELEQAEEDLQDLLEIPAVKEVLAAQRKAAANSPTFNPADLPDYTYADPYAIDDMQKMLVCITAEYNPNTQQVDVIKADPNDPSELFDVMSRSERASTQGTLRKFEEAGVTNTSQVSQFFAEVAMNKVYEKYALKSAIVSRATSSNVNVLKANFNEKEGHSYLFSAANKDFHNTFHKNFLLQMNHRITQEAIEKNRTYYPSGEQRRPFLQDSFTWDKFEAMAAQCASDAFKRTQHIVRLQQTQEYLQQRFKTYSEQFKAKLQPKIKDDNFIEGFGKTFKAHKNETQSQTIKRIKSEFKEFSNKKFVELKGKGMEVILAQGIAISRGAESVTADHIKEAIDLFNMARKRPVEFRSASRIIHLVAGNDKDLANSMLHNLDGRSSLQKSRKTLERMGMHLHANQAGRTKVRKEDTIHGQAFMASATLGVPRKPLKTAMAQAMKTSGYSVEEVIAVRKRMQKNVGRIKDDSGKDTNRERILSNVAPGAERKLQRDDQKPKPGRQDDNDDGGYTPDGSGGGRGKKPRR